MAMKHTKVSAVADSADANLIQPSHWNADHVVDADGLTFTARVDTLPNAPVNKMTLFARNLANKIIPSFIGADGGVSTLQSHMGRGKIYFMSAHGNGTVVTLFGASALVVTGMTTASKNVATTNLLTETRRISYVSAATANTASNIRSSSAQFFCSAAAGRGGFFKIIRFGAATKVAGDRMFLGMGASAAAYGIGDPSAYINIIGIGYDAADTQWQIMHNDGTATATKIPLGVNFPINTTDLLEFIMFAEAGAGAVVHTLVRNLSTGLIDSIRTISTKLPAANTLLLWHGQVNTGATASSSAFDFASLYIESDT